MTGTFSDLPDALVRDLLASATPVADAVRSQVEALRASRGKLRQDAQKAGLVKRKADLDVPREPSVAGVDGSYQIHRLTSLDLCAAAAVAVEGTSKEAQRHWPEPYHRVWVGNVPHNEDTTGVLRGLMVTMELDLASEAPHDLVLLDGSFASLIIYLNQGLSNVTRVPGLGTELKRCWQAQGVLGRLLSLIRSERTIALPKFTSRNELAALCSFAGDNVDGRTLATLLLEPGEYTAPVPIYVGDELDKYHLPQPFYSQADRSTMIQALGATRAVYYRPFRWVPALRLEVPGAIANSATRLSMVLEGITRQYFSPSVVEPYPLFLADRMVKSLGAGVSVIEQTVAQHVVDQGVDAELTMLLLQNYRTEGGRGGAS